MPNEYVYVLRLNRPELLKTGPSADEAEILGRHVEYLRRLADAGTLVLAGRTQTDDEKTFGVAIFRAEDLEAAEAIVAADPAVAGGVMRAEVYPFRVAVSGSL